MADDTSTDIPEDIADVSLIDPLPEDEPDTEATSEAAPAESKDDAEAKPSEETTDKTETSEAKDTEATPETPKDDTQEQPETQTDKGKPDPALAYKAYQERQQRKQAVEQQLDTVYGPKSQEQLEQEGLDPVQAQVQALREEMTYAQQRTQIAELNAGMQAEAVNALNDFPVFNEKSPEYDADFAASVQSRYQRFIETDPETGLILRADEPLYDFYKEMNDIYTRGTSKGSQQGQADAMQMLSRTEDIGGSSSVNKGPETLEEMAERLGDIPIT